MSLSVRQNTVSLRLSRLGYAGGVVLVLLAGLCWSFIPTVVRQFEATTLQILLYRSIGVVPMVLLLIAITCDGPVSKAVISTRWVGLIGGLGLVAAYAGGIGAVRMTGIANAAFLFASAPFIAAILGRVILKETLRPGTVISIVVAMVGILVMVYEGFSVGNWLGDLVALGSACGFAVFTIALRMGKAGNTLPTVLVGAVLSAVFAVVVLWWTGQGMAIAVEELLLALALGCLVLGTGMVLYTLGSGVVPAADLALLAMVEVVLAPVWAWLFLGEVPASTIWLGGSILIAAIVFNALSGIRRKAPPVTF